MARPRKTQPKRKPVVAEIDTIETFSREELDALLYKAIKTAAPKGKRDRAIFLTAYIYMLRASEVGMLRRSDVDTKNHRLRIHRLKRGIGGEFELHPKVARAIKAYLGTRKDDSPILFLSRNGNPISRQSLDLLTKQYGEAAGIPKTKRHFHVLRHTGVTHWLESSNGNRPAVQARAGHRNPASTDHYTHLTNAYQDEVGREAFATGKFVLR